MRGKSPTEDVYGAVADPARRELIRLLARPLYEITTHFQIGSTAVSKHLAILKEADLVWERKVGRETKYSLNAEPMKEIQDWVPYYEGFWKDRFVKLHKLLEEDL